MIYSKTCVNLPLSNRSKIGFQNQLSFNAGQKYCRMLPLEHSAILLSFIKLPFVIKIFVLSIFEWPFYTGFIVYTNLIYILQTMSPSTWPRNMSGNRCESDCRSRGREFDPGPIVKIDHEMSFSSLNHSRKVVVSYKWKYVHEVLVNILFKLAQEKVW